MRHAQPTGLLRTSILILALAGGPGAMSQEPVVPHPDTAPPVEAVDYATLIKDSTGLLGKNVEVVTCAGIPLSDAPQDQNMIALYPCGADISKDGIEKQSIAGILTAKTILKQSQGAQIRDSPFFKGRFRGTLQMRAMDADDKEKTLTILLDEVDVLSPVEMH